MLRSLVLAFAVLLTVGGVALVLASRQGGVGCLFAGGLVLVGCPFERVRYKRLALAAPGPAFERTPERFRDEATGATVSVYVDPATGERSYVRD